MKDQRVDDIVSMIDQFMQNNGGHMNIQVNSNGDIKSEEIRSKSIVQTNSLECAQGDLACNVPTLFEGLDSED